MPTLNLTDEQVIELFQQLPPASQDAVFRGLVSQRWPVWTALSDAGQQRARRAAQERGLDWDALSEDEREALIDRIVHEGRQ